MAGRLKWPVHLRAPATKERGDGLYSGDDPLLSLSCQTSPMWKAIVRNAPREHNVFRNSAGPASRIVRETGESYLHPWCLEELV